MEKKATIKYLLSEEGRKNSLLNGGDGKMQQVLEIEISERVIKLAEVDNEGNVILNIGHRFVRSSIYEVNLDYTINDYGIISSKTDVVYFDKPMTADELILWEENKNAYLNSKHDELKIKSEEIITQNKIDKELKQKKKTEEAKAVDDKKKLEDEERKLLVEKKKQKQEKYENERLQWIELKGSQYLKDAIRLGYNINRNYVIERAEYEFPDYEVDYHDNAAWDSRSNPSEEALDEVKELIEKGYDAEVVWLTSSVDDSEYGRHYFEECEAIAIRNYLRKYDLVKIM